MGSGVSRAGSKAKTPSAVDKQYNNNTDNIRNITCSTIATSSSHKQSDDNHQSSTNVALSDTSHNRNNYVTINGSEESRAQIEKSIVSGSPPQNGAEDAGAVLEEEVDDDEAENELAATFFAHTALSLGMESEEDLLFNLMYFESRAADGDGPRAATFGAMMDNVQQETLALHSSSNTPYKLKPASESAIAQLSVEVYAGRGGEGPGDGECAVCRDEMEERCAVVRLPACGHLFHEECLMRWIKLQGWCPVCRADITASVSAPTNSQPPPSDEENTTAAAASGDLVVACAPVNQKLLFGPDDDGEEDEDEEATCQDCSSGI